MMAEARRPRVVVVGAGFGGLWAIRALAKAPVDVTLVDRNNYHTFLPLLYQVAAAELSPEEIAYPVRGVLRKARNVRFVMATGQALDLKRRVVQTDSDEIPYDYLILGLGTKSAFFGVAGAAEHAYRLKTLDQAASLRNHILGCFERASHEPDPARRQQLLTFAIIGGGAMGVEFAGALGELIHGPLRRDYAMADTDEVRILLVEATDHLLPEFSPRLQSYCLRRLQRMGVEVRFSSPVAQVEAERIHLRGGEIIDVGTVVWTAGVRGQEVEGFAGLNVNRRGQIPVEETLQLADHPEVYVVGDLAAVASTPLPMVAPVAIQQGSAAGRNIARQVASEPAQPFRYKDRGRMATIGRNAAVAEVAGMGFTGLVAWLLWLVIHLFNLIGFRNRVIVLINWAWDYLFMERAIRLILSCPPEDAGVGSSPE